MNRYFTNRLAQRAAFGLFVFAALAARDKTAGAARLPGAPRALTVRFTDDLPLLPIESSLSQPAVGPSPASSGASTVAYPLYFTRTVTTRNIYRAALKLNRMSGAPGEERSDDDDSAELNGDTRFLTSVAPISASPVTRLAAPLWADSAVPLADGRTLLCVTNSLASTRDRAGGFDQIARIDVRSGAMRPLTPADSHYGSPVISPDGRAVAFSCDRSGTDDIYVAQIDDDASNNLRPRRVARLVRRPVWLDNENLAVENLLPGANGLARVNLREAGKTPAEARKLWTRGGHSSFDGRLLCVAAPHPLKDDAKVDTEAETQLYLLSSDGSGARALGETLGADEPLFAPDGSFLLYDAPSASPNDDEKTRGLWLVPMRRVAPVARLDRVRPLTGNTLAIVGTAFSNDNAPLAVVEWGEGHAPSRWNSLPTSAPVHGAVLARWTPPSARGEWTLRLRVEDADGDSSQSLLSVSLPSSLPAPVTAPPVFADAALPARPAAALPAAAQPVPVQPVPALPEAPDIPPAVLPAQRAPESAVLGRPPADTTVVPVPVSEPVRLASKSRPAAKPAPYRDHTAPVHENAATPKPRADDAAVLTVTGIPYEVRLGETLNLSASLRNVGRNGWRITGDSAVRLLVRWHDAKTKGRSRWAIRWLRADVPPGGVGKLDFTIPAPSRAGDYILRFSLVRVGPQGYEPPAYSQSADERYPGEFGVATTTMPVRP